ncbi:MAG TPA: hypothetical protein DCZ06_04770 [Alphaproteobacteria bacterium]|nr:hypothetical protein [Alphaproteobacteria bacterium]
MNKMKNIHFFAETSLAFNGTSVNIDFIYYKSMYYGFFSGADLIWESSGFFQATARKFTKQ